MCYQTEADTIPYADLPRYVKIARWLTTQVPDSGRAWQWLRRNKADGDLLRAVLDEFNAIQHADQPAVAAAACQ